MFDGSIYSALVRRARKVSSSDSLRLLYSHLYSSLRLFSNPQTLPTFVGLEKFFLGCSTLSPKDFISMRETAEFVYHFFVIKRISHCLFVPDLSQKFYGKFLDFARLGMLKWQIHKHALVF